MHFMYATDEYVDESKRSLHYDVKQPGHSPQQHLPYIKSEEAKKGHLSTKLISFLSAHSKPRGHTGGEDLVLGNNLDGFAMRPLSALDIAETNTKLVCTYTSTEKRLSS